MSDAVASAPEDARVGANLPRWLGIAALVYLLLCAVSMIGSGFKAAAGDQARELFAFATNPFTGLIIGTVATALIQSSSTVTSIIVGLVAGGLPVATAVPMVMGANIGTTITNTIVSLGHVREKEEFRRAFAAATVHDVFNLLSVVIFLPLEMAFAPLEKAGLALAGLFRGGGGVDLAGFSVVKAMTQPTVELFQGITGTLPLPWSGVALAVIGVGLIFVSITAIGGLLRQLMVGRAKAILHRAVGRGPLAGICSGTAITMLVQSSSTTTSLMVPLAGSGVFGLREIYPFTLGANIGTTVTALLAATAVTGSRATFALEIAMIHFLYNLLGVLLIFGLPFLRDIPVRGAEWLAKLGSERKSLALAYILLVFFALPGALLFLTTGS